MNGGERTVCDCSLPVMTDRFTRIGRTRSLTTPACKASRGRRGCGRESPPSSSHSFRPPAGSFRLHPAHGRNPHGFRSSRTSPASASPRSCMRPVCRAWPWPGPDGDPRRRPRRRTLRRGAPR